MYASFKFLVILFAFNEIAVLYSFCLAQDYSRAISFSNLKFTSAVREWSTKLSSQQTFPVMNFWLTLSSVTRNSSLCIYNNEINYVESGKWPNPLPVFEIILFLFYF